MTHGDAATSEDRPGDQGFTGLMAPWTPFRMVKGRLWLFISRKPISADCAHHTTCQVALQEHLAMCCLV